MLKRIFIYFKMKQASRQYAPAILPGDLLFYTGNDRISRLISRLEKSPYVHVVMAIDSEHIIEADMFERIAIKKAKSDNYKLMRADLTEEQKEALIGCALKFVGNKYNYIGVIIWIFRLLFKTYHYGIFNPSKRMYCSELVSRAYYCIGINLLPDRPPGDVLPSELMQSPLLKEVI